MTAHIYPAPVHADGAFETDDRCPACGDTLVNVSHEGDRYPVLLCTNVSCLSEPLYTLMAECLIPFCALHDQPVNVCGCMED